MHSAFKIGMDRKNTSMRVDQIASFRYVFRGTQLIMTDEISMVGSDVFHVINSKMGRARRMFGGYYMIFSKDLRQLPPVRAQPVYRRSRSRIGGDDLWHRLRYYSLKQVMRQSDKMFAMLLTKIGNGDKLSGEECKVIKGRFMSAEKAKEVAPDAMRLSATNNEVEEFNHGVAEDMGAKVVIAKDEYMGHPSVEQLTSMRSKMHKPSVMETSGLPYLLHLKEGMPYMLTTNVYVQDGLVNGLVGALKYIEYTHLEDRIGCLWFDFGSNMAGRVHRSRMAAVVKMNPNLEKGWTSIDRRTATTTFAGKYLTTDAVSDCTGFRVNDSQITGRNVRVQKESQSDIRLRRDE